MMTSHEDYVLARKIEHCLHQAGLTLEKIENKPANIGMLPSIALAVQMNKVLKCIS